MPRGPHRYATLSKVRRLRFPPAYPPTTKDRHEPSTAIASFSTGRSHVLGLADDGRVWQWNNEEARQIRPLHVEVGGKRVTRVVAGKSMIDSTTLSLLIKRVFRMGPSLHVRQGYRDCILAS